MHVYFLWMKTKWNVIFSRTFILFLHFPSFYHGSYLGIMKKKQCYFHENLAAYKPQLVITCRATGTRRRRSSWKGPTSFSASCGLPVCEAEEGRASLLEWNGDSWISHSTDGKFDIAEVLIVLLEFSPKYLVVNADEGEPGTCKDREIMRHDPHKVEIILQLSKVIIKLPNSKRFPNISIKIST